MLVGLDPDTLTSISQAAETAYLASGVANTLGMLPSISVRGGSVFATDAGHPASWKGQAMWMPRVSAAYKLGERMVLKGGWGLYYDTLNAGDVANGRLSLPDGYGVPRDRNSADLGRTLLQPQRGRGPFLGANGSASIRQSVPRFDRRSLLGTASRLDLTARKRGSSGGDVRARELSSNSASSCVTFLQRRALTGHPADTARSTGMQQ